ncbi:zinc-dependent alcohol dehydrogenase family protein [Glycomyces buryatensis]|uniref:NADPH:quinone reductase n=1 Tax=Glycomyces buryatensis TaxID=2570927 RepID=A0A4S8QIH8_9ACTN|nr:zinc-dependent alcohol dehydrogenase family protein [Glycomyces buryatensis]THV43062.1 NADPH:quinone reductase [Glycomyces buryatensis]
MAKTVRFHDLGGPEVMTFEEVPLSDPGPGEVSLRVEAIGINRAEALFRNDTYIESPRQLPSGLGSEASGTIEAVGPGVTDYVAGQSVSVVPSFSQNDYSMYAERVIAPTSALVPRPAGINPVTGAAAWMSYLTAYGALVDVGGMRPGDTVVLNAASSSVGLAVIQIAVRSGAIPIALTRTEEKADRLREAGAAAVIVTETDDIAERVLTLTEGRGARFVFDAVAGPGVTDLAKTVAPNGTHFLYGALSGRPTPFPGFELGMPALNFRTFTMHEVSRDPTRMKRAAAYLNSGLLSGALRPVIDRVFDFEEIVKAHRHMESGTQFGKIVATVKH